MADYLVTDTELTSIADAIRTKGDTSADLSFPIEFISAIQSIQTGLEYEEGTWEPTEDIARGWIPFSNTHTDPPVLVALADVTGTAHSELNTNYNFVYFDHCGLWGEGIPYGTSDFRYVSIFYNVRTTSATSITTGSRVCSQKSSSTESSSAAYPRYWADPTGFHPYSYSTSRYWRAGRTYKWIAIWK